MPIKGPLINSTGAAVVISCGGSAGPEGPIASLGAAIGSGIGGLFPVTARERRVLLIAGCAAGVGAIFRCPLGGALFATSVLYSESDFESDAIVPAVVASVIGYSTYMLFWGFQGPMLKGVSGLNFSRPIELLPYLVLGPLCGLISIFFYYSVRIVDQWLVHRSHLPRWSVPAVGGLATGVLACFLPQVMDGRYVFIQNVLDLSFLESGGHTDWWSWAALLGLIVLAKCVATGTTVGSGAPGGVLGPSVFIGGAVGAFLGATCQGLMAGQFPESLRQSMIPVGMAGVLAATMRTPLAAIVMVTEMTGSYGLIAPLMLVCATSYLIGRRWGLNRQQLRTIADSPTHSADHIIHMLQSWPVNKLMDRRWKQTVTPDTGLAELVAGLEPGTRPVVAVARDDELVGVVSASDLGRVMDQPHVAHILLASDIMTRRMVCLGPTDSIEYALSLFHRSGHEVLPVVARGHGRKWLGMLSRKHIVENLRQDIEQMYASVLREHEGLGALDDELRIHQMLLPVSQAHATQIQRLFVPIQAVGRSLRQADFRRQFGAQVIAIEQRDGTLQCPPDIDTPLKTEYRLLAILKPTEPHEPTRD